MVGIYIDRLRAKYSKVFKIYSFIFIKYIFLLYQHNLILDIFCLFMHLNNYFFILLLQHIKGIAVVKLICIILA